VKKLAAIIFLAFVLRVVLSLLAEHGDVINYYWWAKDLATNGLEGFYERNIANAVRPTYPPITSYLFFLTASVHKLLFRFIWFLNIRISIFPSDFVHWWESEKGWYFINKFPAIVADIFIVYFLYYFVSGLSDKKKGLIAAAVFAFIPPFWYNSSLWGQTDSLFALPLLGSFIALQKKRKILAIFLFVLSVLTKPTALFVFLPFFLWWFQKINIKSLLLSVIVVFWEIYLLYFPFHPQGTTAWIFDFYRKSLGGELNYMVANSFNFWGLIYGFDNKVDTTLLFGLTSRFVGYLIFAFFGVILFWVFLKVKKKTTPFYLLLSVLFSFAAFMFLPRMHERYFYPTLLFMVPLMAIEKETRKAFWVGAFIHLINLYHFWWVPKIELFITLFKNVISEKAIIILNIALFFWFLKYFWKKYAPPSQIS